MKDPQSVFQLIRAVGGAQRSAVEVWIREAGLSVEQGLTLNWLTENPGARQKDVAAASRTSAASASSLLQGLERRGLVERRTQDGDERSKRVHATTLGAELVSGLDAALVDVEASLLAPLEPSERSELVRLLSKVADHLPERSEG